MADATCATCPAFRGSESGTVHAYGECRAAPPISFHGDGCGEWPAVDATDWCMQHPLRRRHLLALHAMTGLAADPDFRGEVGPTAYKFADSMLDEAEKSTTPDTDPEEILP
jgi:hypothetical protein